MKPNRPSKGLRSANASRDGSHSSLCVPWPWHAWLAVGLLGAAAGPTRGLALEVVFENFGRPLASHAPVVGGRPVEFGDEIVLAGTARMVTQFQFDYVGRFTTHGDETARVRFYANDRAGDYLKPGTLLFESAPFPIQPGSQRTTLDLPRIAVPNSFTWTVEFGGITQQPDDQAELLVASPPRIGAPLSGGRVGSYDDYWRRVGSDWNLYSLSVPANFAAKVMAEVEMVDITAVHFPAGGILLSWSGQPSTRYQLQGSIDGQSWSDFAVVRTLPDGFGAHLLPLGSAWQQFRGLRLLEAPAPARMMVTPHPSTRSVLIQWNGPPNLLYQLKYAEDLRTWRTLATVKAGAQGVAEYEDVAPARSPRRAYRVWTPW